MRIPEIRLQNQQLSTPLFGHPKELVSWMGAMQAQDYTMVKWAVGMRLKSPGIQAVEKALHQGEILRTHVMRPTWHLVAAEDIRWMLKLSAQRIKSANDSYAKGHGLEITEQQYDRSHTVLGNILSGKRSLTKQEIAEHFERSGLLADNYHMTRFMSRAEVEGIVCSGECHGRATHLCPSGRKSSTYPRTDERRSAGPPGYSLFPQPCPCYPARLLLVVWFAFNGSKASHFSDRTGTDVRTMEQPDMVHP